jgi:amidophosphoribosyltransferase
VYFARPDSMLDRISVYRTRTRFGQALAQQWKELKAPMPDVVIPIPIRRATRPWRWPRG